MHEELEDFFLELPDSVFRFKRSRISVCPLNQGKGRTIVHMVDNHGRSYLVDMDNLPEVMQDNLYEYQISVTEEGAELEVANSVQRKRSKLERRYERSLRALEKTEKKVVSEREFGNRGDRTVDIDTEAEEKIEEESLTKHLINKNFT